MKKIMTAAFIIATIALGAQTSKMKKACIKMESDDNGKVTKIDTCVTAATNEELQQKLNALGMGNTVGAPVPPIPPLPPGIPQISIETDSLAEGSEYKYSYVIVSDDGEDAEAGHKSKGKQGKTKIVSSSVPADGEAHVIIMDGEGNIIHGGADPDGKTEIKQLKKGEKMDPEIEKLLKEYGMDEEKSEGKKIIIKNTHNKNGKEKHNEVSVFVFSKMEVKKLSDADKKQLPASASKTIQNAKRFDDLTVSPNPTDDACKISYTSSSKEPLQINVYDENGKTVYTETDKSTGQQINKTISLKELGKGIYFVHLTQGKQSEVRKVIVK